MMTPRLFAAIVLTALALITVTVVVGLARDNLDPNGVVAVLVALLTGGTVGGIIKAAPLGKTPPPAPRPAPPAEQPRPELEQDTTP